LKLSADAGDYEANAHVPEENRNRSGGHNLRPVENGASLSRMFCLPSSQPNQYPPKHEGRRRQPDWSRNNQASARLF
jgi:hypothetical protein